MLFENIKIIPSRIWQITNKILLNSGILIVSIDIELKKQINIPPHMTSTLIFLKPVFSKALTRLCSVYLK